MVVRSLPNPYFRALLKRPSPRQEFINPVDRVIVGDTRKGAWDLWLKGDPEAAAALMKPANEDGLVGRPVNKAVGNVKNNEPELLA